MYSYTNIRYRQISKMKIYQKIKYFTSKIHTLSSNSTVDTAVCFCLRYLPLAKFSILSIFGCHQQTGVTLISETIGVGLIDWSGLFQSDRRHILIFVGSEVLLWQSKAKTKIKSPRWTFENQFHALIDLKVSSQKQFSYTWKAFSPSPIF